MSDQVEETTEKAIEVAAIFQKCHPMVVIDQGPTILQTGDARTGATLREVAIVAVVSMTSPHGIMGDMSGIDIHIVIEDVVIRMIVTEIIEGILMIIIAIPIAVLAVIIMETRDGTIAKKMTQGGSTTILIILMTGMIAETAVVANDKNILMTKGTSIRMRHMPLIMVDLLRILRNIIQSGQDKEIVTKTNSIDMEEMQGTLLPVSISIMVPL